MSLSIIPLTQPMYNVYRVYEEVYNKYGTEVYVDTLLNKNAQSTGAPTTTVKALADVYCDSLLTLYNLRIAINIRRASENGIALFYMWLAVLLALMITIAIWWVVLSKYLKLVKEGGGKGGIDAVTRYFNSMMFGLSAVTVAFVFIIVIVVFAYTRKRNANNKINNVSFGDQTSLFSDLIKTVYPEVFLLKLPDNSKKYAKYSLLRGEGRRYRSFMSLLQKMNLFELVEMNEGGKSLIAYKPTTIILGQPLRSDQLALQVIATYALKQRGINILSAQLEGKVSKVPFPGFAPVNGIRFTPSLLLRDIQQIDIVGQVNRIGDAVYYFKELLKKDTSDSGQNNRGKIIEDIKSIFTSKAIISNSFVPTTSYDVTVLKTDIGESGACTNACRNNVKCAFSVFDNDAGSCALIPKDVTKHYPMYYINDKDKNARWDVYIKDGQEVYVAAPLKPGNIKTLPQHMSFINNSKKSLEKGQACLYDAKFATCVGQNYAAAQETTDYTNVFKDSKYDQATMNYAKNAQNFTMRADSSGIINKSVDDIATFERNREVYLTQVIDSIKRNDPTLQFTLEASDISAIANDAAGAWPTISFAIKEFVMKLLEEIPARLAIESSALTSLVGAADPRDSKYLSGEELIAKIEAMNQQEFIGNFVAHAYDMYSCGTGLHKMQQFYDYTLEDLGKGKLLLTLFSTLFIVEGGIGLGYFAYKTIPKYLKKLEELDKKIAETSDGNMDDKARKQKLKELSRTKSNTIMNYIAKYIVSVAIIMVVFIILLVSSRRTEQIGMYNFDVMTKNGDILRQNASSLIDFLMEEINSGAIMSLPEKSELFSVIKKNDNRIYLIDAFKENMAIFDNKKLVTVTNLDGKYLRNKLVDMIEAHEKCNALLFGGNITMPFPIYEVSIYAFLLLLILACWLYVTFKLEPLKNLQKIRYWKRVGENRRRNKILAADEYEFENEDGEGEAIDADTEFMLKVLMMFVVILATMLFTSQLLKSTTQLNTALYGSNLYRTNTCYKY